MTALVIDRELALAHRLLIEGAAMTKKLTLATETLRPLNTADLQRVNGGLSIVDKVRSWFRPNVFTEPGFISSSGSGG